MGEKITINLKELH